MIVLGKYSFNNGKEVIEDNYAALLQEVCDTIVEVDSSECLTKKSKEKTMPGKILYNPRTLNERFKIHFAMRGWTNKKVKCDYPTQYYVDGYKHEKSRGASV